MEDKKKKSGTKIAIIVMFLILSISLIGVGVYFNIISSDSYIMGTVIDRTNNLFMNYLENNSYEIRDSYSINSKIDVNVDSEKYKNESAVNLDSLKKANFLKNLTNMNTEVNLVQDAKNKKIYFELSETLMNEELVNYKYLVNNSTEYYFLNNFVNTYVNNGSCNYFESLDTENTSKDNFYYIYNFIIDSLKKNLKHEYFSDFDVDQVVDGDKVAVRQVSLRLTDDRVREIAKNILADLKEDERAKKILVSIDSNFLKKKIKDSVKFLNKNESYTVNVYTSRFNYKPLKLEIIHLDGDIKKVFSYEGDETKGVLYYIENDKTVYEIECIFNKNKYEFGIRDEVDTNVGKINFEFDKKRTNFTFNFDDNSNKIDFNYTSKYLVSSGNTKINDIKFTFNYVENKVGLFNGDIHVVSEIAEAVKIDEDVSTATLKASLDDDKVQMLNNRREEVKARLER